MENVVTVKCEPDWPESIEPLLESIEEPQCVLEEDSNAVTEVWVKPEPDSEDLISEDPDGVESNNQEQNCSAGNMQTYATEVDENSEASKDEVQEDKLNPDLFNEVHIHSHTDHLNCSCGKAIIHGNSVPPPLPKSKKKFLCELCPKSFGRRGHLKSHLLSHTGEKNFRCDVCFKFFSKKEHLNRHLIIHTGEKKYSCSLCSKQFGQSSTLNRHMFTHTGQKDFKCPVCGKEFVQRDHLNRHLVTHSGEKKYECPVCNKQFALRCNVKQHLVSHTKEKKFSCSLCDKHFAFKSVLKKHAATHENGGEFKCSVCFKDFERSSSLKRHEATHTIVVGMPTLPIVYRGTPANSTKQSSTLAAGQETSTNKQIFSTREEVLKTNDVEELTVDPDIPEHGLSSSDYEETSS